MKNPEGVVRYSNVRIDPTPTKEIPTVVTITKTPTQLNELKGKRFKNIEFAKYAIHTVYAINRICRHNINRDNKSFIFQE